MSLRQLWELMLKQEELKAKLEDHHQEWDQEAHQEEEIEDLHQVKVAHHQEWDQVVHQAKAAHQAKDLLQACKTEDLHQAWKVAHLQLKWAHHQAEATHWVANDESKYNKI